MADCNVVVDVRCSRSVSPPCASPATLLSSNLGSTLSVTSPVAIRLHPQLKKVVLKMLSVADCPVGLLLVLCLMRDRFLITAIVAFKLRTESLCYFV